MMHTIDQVVDQGLTGVGSRSDFQSALCDAWRNGQREGSPLALLLVEIDFFDPYQFACGLAASETCLESVADVLLEITCRVHAQIFVDGPARFAVLVPGATPTAAARLADEIHFQVGGLVITHPRSPVSRSVSVSVGVSCETPQSGRTSRQLYEAAARALTGARTAGRDRVVRRDELLAV
jgi:diguanylate cyclase (GGDEF)-like protein